MVDVTEFKQVEAALRTSEARLRDQASILEMIATSTPRADTLAEICRMVESNLPSVRCTILLVDEERRELVHGAAPSFPASFLQSIDGMPIAEGSGVCGTAAATGVPVYREDILGDPSCAEYQDLAREHDLRSCWSYPIRAASDERVLGTVAAYLSEVRGPTAVEEAAIDSVVQLAAIAIERTQFEDQLAHQAHHDPLTRLANRTLFGELLEHSLRRAQRAGTGVAVLFLDLDRFKVVNDSLGHDAGDELLVALGRRLGGVLRPGDVVARFGGDEFTVLCEDLEPGLADRQAIAVAERLIDALREPFLVEGEEQFVSASVGIAISITGLERPEALVRDADAAMYRAKERGKGRCEVFDEQMRDRARQRHEIENALHRAVARAEFRVFFQPMISLREGTCVGVEALARWQHPERGLLTPGDFLGTAEETGLVVPIGAWVLEEACRQAVGWRDALPSNGTVPAVGQPLGASARACRARRPRRRSARDHRLATGVAVRRDHRDRAHGRHRGGGRSRQGTQGARGAREHRRLRDRVLDAGLPAAVPGGRREDRSHLRGAPGHRAGGRCHRRGRREPRPRARRHRHR